MGARLSACMCRAHVSTSSVDRTRKGRLLQGGVGWGGVGAMCRMGKHGRAVAGGWHIARTLARWHAVMHGGLRCPPVAQSLLSAEASRCTKRLSTPPASSGRRSTPTIALAPSSLRPAISPHSRLLQDGAQALQRVLHHVLRRQVDLGDHKKHGDLARKGGGGAR